MKAFDAVARQTPFAEALTRECRMAHPRGTGPEAERAARRIKRPRDMGVAPGGEGVHAACVEICEEVQGRLVGLLEVGDMLHCVAWEPSGYETVGALDVLVELRVELPHNGELRGEAAHVRGVVSLVGV